MTRTQRRIDHLVVAVHDLDAAGAFYQRLGFQVGARNRHPWGTENRLIQFGTSFIELISVGPDPAAIPDHEAGRFSFGAFVRDYLGQREGLAMLVLDSADAKADAARFARAGIGSFEPFFFERQGRRPDGSQTHVAFTLAFAVDALAPQAGFFVCQQHFPENFWNPAFQRHENGAAAIAEIGMSAPQPAAHAEFLARFSGSPVDRHADGSLSIELRDGRLRVAPAKADTAGLELRSLLIGVTDTPAQATRLASAGIPFTEDHGRLIVPPEAAFGLTIGFAGGSADR